MEDRFERMDRALRAGMQPFVKKSCKAVDFDVGRHGTRASEMAESKDELVKYTGRQILWLFLREYDRKETFAAGMPGTSSLA